MARGIGWSVPLLVLVSGCVSTNAIRLGEGAIRPPIEPERVAIYRTAEQVPGEYDEVGLLTATGDSLWTNEEHMYNSLRKKAAKLGANGVILGGMHEPGAATKAAMAVLFGVGGERKGKALAIYVRPAGSTTAAVQRSAAKAVTVARAPMLTTGTGFFVTESGYLVTAAHVVGSERAHVAIRLGDGTEKAASIVRLNPADDVAILKVEGHFSALPLLSGDASAELRLGASVFTIGFPNPEVQGLLPKLTSGQVSAIAGMHDDSRHYQVSIPVQPGNSGGPLIDATGSVAGVVSAKLNDIAALAVTGSLPQTVNYAIKIAPVKYLLRSIPDLDNYALIAPKRVPQTAEQIAKMAAPACALVVAEDDQGGSDTAATSTRGAISSSPTLSPSIPLEGPTSQGKLHIVTRPPGARVDLNSAFVGVTTPGGLDIWSDAGAVSIRVSNPGYQEVVKVYDVTAGRSQTLTIELAPSR
jgi:S1-C subfamily serine protease